MFNSIAVNAMPAEGYSTGDAIRAVQENGEIALPKGYGYDFSGINYRGKPAEWYYSHHLRYLYLDDLLILSALYESFDSVCRYPEAVPAGLMAVPCQIAGLENNIYLQTGSYHADRSVGKDCYSVDGVCRRAP